MYFFKRVKEFLALSSSIEATLWNEYPASLMDRLINYFFLFVDISKMYGLIEINGLNGFDFVLDTLKN